MARSQKGYIGLAMEGPIATWYTKNTGRDLRRFIKVAETVARPRAARRSSARGRSGARVLCD